MSGPWAGARSTHTPLPEAIGDVDSGNTTHEIGLWTAVVIDTLDARPWVHWTYVVAV